MDTPLKEEGSKAEKQKPQVEQKEEKFGGVAIAEKKISGLKLPITKAVQGTGKGKKENTLKF